MFDSRSGLNTADVWYKHLGPSATKVCFLNTTLEHPPQLGDWFGHAIIIVYSLSISSGVASFITTNKQLP